MGADLLEFAVPENADDLRGRKNFKAAAKSLGRQTLRKQLGSGSRKRGASRIIAKKSAGQNSQSQRDIFTNISH